MKGCCLYVYITLDCSHSHINKVRVVSGGGGGNGNAVVLSACLFLTGPAKREVTLRDIIITLVVIWTGWVSELSALSKTYICLMILILILRSFFLCFSRRRRLYFLSYLPSHLSI